MPGFTEMRSDEREQLLAYLAQQRYLLGLTGHGLTDEQARSTPSASELSVGGLIKHVTRTERHWIDIVRQRQQAFGSTVAHYAEGFRLGPEETLRAVLDDYAEAARETEAVVRDLPVDHPVPVPRDVPWFPKEIGAWTLRWVLLHLIEETARHVGHADIVRESLDGATWFPLMAAAEHSPPNPWIRPWQPPAERSVRPAR